MECQDQEDRDSFVRVGTEVLLARAVGHPNSLSSVARNFMESSSLQGKR